MKYLYTLLFISASISCFSQNGYQNGVIISTDNDSLLCKVPMTTSFGEKFTIITIPEGTQNTINVSEVKYLINPFAVYEQVTYMRKNKNQQKLMKIVTTGTMNLYVEIIMNPGTTTSSPGMTYTSYNSPTTIYVAKKNDLTYYIPKKKFSEHILPLINDVPEITEKIEKRKYKYKDLETLVKDYNEQTKYKIN